MPMPRQQGRETFQIRNKTIVIYDTLTNQKGIIVDLISTLPTFWMRFQTRNKMTCPKSCMLPSKNLTILISVLRLQRRLSFQHSENSWRSTLLLTGSNTSSLKIPLINFRMSFQSVLVVQPLSTMTSSSLQSAGSNRDSIRFLSIFGPLRERSLQSSSTRYHVSSPHGCPVVMIRKSDGCYRITIDFRQLIFVTIFDVEPTCSVEGDLYKSAGVEYFFIRFVQGLLSGNLHSHRINGTLSASLRSRHGLLQLHYTHANCSSRSPKRQL